MNAVTGGKRRVAIVLFNLGGPDGPKAVRPFLFNLFNDPAIITVPAPLRLALATLISSTRAKSARANYARMGGRSPLLPETTAQAQALQAAMDAIDPGLETRIFIAMRYWTPTSAETAVAVKDFAPDEIVLLPLYPQFSSTTTASSLAAWRKAYNGPGVSREVCCYPLADGFIQAHADRILQAWRAAGAPRPVRLLFSAHGLPEQIINGGDPYQAQVEATAAAVAGRLMADADWPDLDWKVCYQSRVGRLKWIGPTTPETIEEAARDGLGVVVSPIAFVSEHIETLVELDHEYAELAKELGIEIYIRAPALGVQQTFIDNLATMVRDALSRPGGAEPAGEWRCGSQWRHCPARQKKTTGEIKA
jgi:ferrochelatase